MKGRPAVPLIRRMDVAVAQAKGENGRVDAEDAFEKGRGGDRAAHPAVFSGS